MATGSVRRTWGSPSVSVAEIVKRVEMNDPSLKEIDFSTSATFSVRSDEFTSQLATALKRNTYVREINLSNCGVGDKGAEYLAEALAENNGIVSLNLEKNRVNQHGASSLAKGLAHNKKLESLNLMNQATARWGDTCLDDFIEMFNYNVTLLKIFWRLESRKSFAINKFLTRNGEIERRKKNGIYFEDLLPEAVRGTEAAQGSTEGRKFQPTIATPQTNGHDSDQPHARETKSISSAPPSRAANAYPLQQINHERVPRHSEPAYAPRASSPPAEAQCGSLRDRMRMFEQTASGTTTSVSSMPRPSSASPARRWGSAAASVADLIRRVSSNDPAVTSVDFSNSATFQSRGDDYAAQLSEALATNSHVRELNLANCSIGDRGAASLAAGLARNASVQTLVLERNRLGPMGLTALAKGLASNTSLHSLDLMNQVSCGRWGDAAIEDVLEMFNYNVTLCKLTWRLDSRRGVDVNRLLSRNSEIDRRRRQVPALASQIPPPVPIALDSFQSLGW